MLFMGKVLTITTFFGKLSENRVAVPRTGNMANEQNTPDRVGVRSVLTLEMCCLCGLELRL